MISRTINAWRGRTSTQPGSTAKRWDKNELRKCGAIGTTEPRNLNLRGEVHPIFSNWIDADSDLRKELEQPLLLASRILEAAGLPWISDFLAHDVFTEDYPGREPSCRCSFTHSAANSRGDSKAVPQTIVRYHRAPWASEELKQEWEEISSKELRNGLAQAITWELDADMYRERGWVGYTCRHPRCKLPLDELDQYDNIRLWDGGCEDERRRNMTVLFTAESPRKLAELRRQGMEHSEEYLLTAFMAAVTILHELGHVVYWKDTKAITRDLREPYYGADLEMELGDSFVASIFSGWIPVPIKNLVQTQDEFSFTNGLAWKQSLSWDLHRLRPKHRTHYSIPADYIGRLFSEECWQEGTSNPLQNLIRPQTLESAVSELGIYTQT
ncbi:hypothetical protein M426DRAFT_201329 [Hypoxylon sp. CI-4A]|nr:hypothetical protein M426DRAFT_201329 [Hypoxylon sp. CI-4A]